MIDPASEPLPQLGEVSPRWFLRLIFILASLLTFWLAVHLGQGGVLFVFWRRTLLVFAVAGLALAFLLIAYFLDREFFFTAVEKITSLFSIANDANNANFAAEKKEEFAPFAHSRWRGDVAKTSPYLRILFSTIILALFIFLLLSPLSKTFQPLPARFILVFLASLLLTFFFSTKNTSSHLLCAFLFTSLLLSILYSLLSSISALSLSPFSRGWSEGTRFYHASLLLSQRYYGLSLPPFYQDLSRYVVEAIPLLLPRPSLFLERLWEAALSIILPALTAALVLHRLAPAKQNRALWLAIFLWGTLYLLQGPVYFYLLLAAIPVLAFYNPKKPLPSFIALLAASLWAGISRVNWIPIPAMLAIALYLLEVPLPSPVRPPSPSPVSSTRASPALRALLGLVSAYAARQWYFSISDIPSAMFNAAFWQDLLWYRLFPSALQPLGILPAGLLMTAPLALLVWARLRQNRWDWMRVAGLVSMLLVLLVGGFIVSAKIGGGSNLHNLDGYLTLSLVVGLYLLADRFAPDRERDAPPRAFSPLAVTLAVLAAAFFSVSQVYPALPSLDRRADSLARLQQLVDEAADQGPVLFITQRHLLTFGCITGVPLVPEYDNIALMEFAMTNYRPLIDQFHADIAAHKYALIIAPNPPGQLKTQDDAFAEENNAWTRRVSIPMLRSYKVIAKFPEGDFVVLIPDE
ncbi:MAG: hypothetical protein M5U11_01820 [Anaerolineales bacterium]|nr:hypothetical protein [Anaerolineales bacterium]